MRARSGPLARPDGDENASGVEPMSAGRGARLGKSADALPTRSHDSAPGRVVDQPEAMGVVGASRTLPTGTVLASRYRVVRLLGRGGMAEVYEAVDEALDRRVALKTLRGDKLGDDVAVARFKREVTLAHCVTHPNVGRVFDVDFDAQASAAGPLAFLTMELLQGETLAERLARVGRLPVTDALPIARSIANALGAAHAAGVIHRDLKPANVMIVSSRAEPSTERVVVLDFGLARIVEDETGAAGLSREGALLGTPAYMAPEQVQGKPTTAASDVYAFGVLLFEMVTGSRPFRAETAAATALMRLTVSPPSPRLLIPTLDERWETVILRCLRRDAAERFASAAEAIAILDGGAGAGAPSRPRRRVSTARVVLAAALLSTLAGAAALSLAGRKAGAAAPISSAPPPAQATAGGGAAGAGGPAAVPTCEPLPSPATPLFPTTLGKRLVLWLNASGNVGLEGMRVSEWADSSGWDAHAVQPLPSARPYFAAAGAAGSVGCRAAVVFSASERLYLQVPDTPALHFGKDDLTIEYVASLSGAERPEGRMFFSKQLAHAPYPGPGLFGFPGGTLGFQVEYKTKDVRWAGDFNDGKPHRIGARRAGDVLQLRVDGAVRETKIAGGPSDLTTHTDLYIGGTGAGFQNITGSIAEIVVVRGAMTDEELASLEGYLDARYETR